MLQTQAQVSEIVAAAGTRTLLEEIERRHSNGYRTADDLGGTRYSPEPSSFKVPIFDQNGKAFASSFMQPNFAITIPDTIKENSIVEYIGNDGFNHYGKVVKTETGETGQVKVHSLSRKEVVEYQTVNPTAKIYSFSSTDVAEITQSPGGLSRIMQFLDTGEKLLFKFLTMLLMRDVLAGSSVVDIFIEFP